MTYTTHYNLKKPGLDDLVAVGDLNDNADAIDQAIYNASQSGGSATAMIEISVEAAETSAHAYAAGDHFIYNGTLYRATAAIAIGDTITPESNCVATTVAGELEGKVDKVTGKQLSTEDYTTAEKTKLSGIEAHANKTVIDSTLTQTGQAADAKAAGDAVGELRNTLNHKADVIYDTASGAIASFPDGADGLPVKDLTVAIEPVQDLHGYDNPWPAGGGKNLLQNKGTTTTINGVTITVNSDGTMNLSGTSTGSVVFSISSSCPLGTDSYILTGGISDVINIGINRPSGERDSDRGNGLSINGNGSPAKWIQLVVSAGINCNGVIIKPMIRLASVSDATFAPYSNICPISGWTGANVSRTGFNVWDEQWELGDFDQQTGEKAQASDAIRSKNKIPVTPSTTYYWKCEKGMWLYQYDASGDYLGISSAFTVLANSTFTTSSKAYFINIKPYSSYGTSYNNDISINYPSTDHNYHPGTGNVTIPISWQSEAGTVYGGTLDVTSGVLTVDRGYLADISTLAWGLDGTNRFYSSAVSGLTKSGILSVSDIVCSEYICTDVPSKNSMPNNSIRRNELADGRLVVKDKRYSNATDFKAGISGVQIAYKLNQPLVIQLDPVTVNTLLGQNNIWADCGPSTVEYPADTKLYIQKINTPIDDDMIADANIASGQYFIINNNLYLSTTAILAGDPIKPGTNCTLTNLAAALNAINS